MSDEQLDAVGERFNFTSWRGINRLDRDLSIRNISMPKDLVAGLDFAHSREIDPGDGTRLLRMSWPVPGIEGALLIMDIRECDSRDVAHNVLLGLLANMQAPDVKRLEADAPGDIAFAQNPATAMIFARGNIALSISNGGEIVVPVDEVARTIDQWIIEQ